MTASELRELAPEELAQKAKDMRNDLFNARVKHTTGQLEDTARLSRLRRDIARVETVIREKGGATK